LNAPSLGVKEILLNKARLHLLSLEPGARDDRGSSQIDRLASAVMTERSAFEYREVVGSAMGVSTCGP
jgi:hypothetical protein